MLIEATQADNRAVADHTPIELEIFLSHPIQHFAPWLRELSRRLDGRLVVNYATRHGLEARHDPEFGESFAWDMDLVSGYQHRFWDDKRGRGPDRGFWGIRYPGLANHLRRHRPRALLVTGWLFAGYWQAATIARRLEIPYLLRGESNLLNRGAPSRWWLKQQTIGRLCRGAAGCLAIGTYNANLYEAYGVPSGRIHMAPYFVDNDWFAAEHARLRSDRTALRAKFGLPAAGTVFLFMGKLIPKKHPDHLIKAWKNLTASSRQQSALLVVGSGAMATELKQMVGSNPRIVFAGLLNRKELPEAYAVSDALVLPSDAGETWGLVVNEAMASELPAIVSDQVGCAPDLVEAGRTGFTFRCGNVLELQYVLQRFIDDRSLSSKLGSAARARVAIATIARAAETTLEALNSTPRRQTELEHA
jgi:glycosyltransferase involved in cell wall biosynthesis